MKKFLVSSSWGMYSDRYDIPVILVDDLETAEKIRDFLKESFKTIFKNIVPYSLTRDDIPEVVWKLFPNYPLNEYNTPYFFIEEVPYKTLNEIPL